MHNPIPLLHATLLSLALAAPTSRNKINIPPTTLPPPIKTATLTNGSAIDVRSLATDAKGLILFCSQHYLKENCVLINAFNTCLRIPDPVHRRGKSLYQWPGVHCRYAFDDTCSDKYHELTLDSLPAPIYKAQLDYAEWNIGSVDCLVPRPPPRDTPPTPPNASRPVKTALRRHAADLLPAPLSPPPTPESNAAPNPPHTVELCTAPHFQGTCRLASAWNRCEEVYPRDDDDDDDDEGIESLVQHRGAVCRYYRDRGCAAGNHSPTRRIDSVAGDVE